MFRCNDTLKQVSGPEPKLLVTGFCGVTTLFSFASLNNSANGCPILAETVDHKIDAEVKDIIPLLTNRYMYFHPLSNSVPYPINPRRILSNHTHQINLRSRHISQTPARLICVYQSLLAHSKSSQHKKTCFILSNQSSQYLIIQQPSKTLRKSLFPYHFPQMHEEHRPWLQ
ncbi:hypothetical protein BLNAU_8589 [Blattamonas nauphoetae]|uniref:Uncharacterized protein n=1 Tax=Blattamonas nauphoetae TaxID=2049346 RepID=A0ABQ9XYF9_9EUKA|nr:hypothetical protein BLNAU_8589 [Blattamonas nauphoetae]